MFYREITQYEIVLIMGNLRWAIKLKNPYLCVSKGCTDPVQVKMQHRLRTEARKTSQFRGGSRIPRRRGRQPSGGRQHMILPNFVKNCRVRPPLNPPLQLTKKLKPLVRMMSHDDREHDVCLQDTKLNLEKMLQ